MRKSKHGRTNVRRMIETDGVTAICSALIVIVVAVVSVCVIGYAVSPNDDSRVYEDLDAYGGTVYLDEATGSGAMSLVSWYVPQDSNVKVTGDYIHVDKAKSYAYSSQTSEIYIPMQAVAYITINNH